PQFVKERVDQDGPSASSSSVQNVRRLSSSVPPRRSHQFIANTKEVAITNGGIKSQYQVVPSPGIGTRRFRRATAISARFARRSAISPAIPMNGPIGISRKLIRLAARVQLRAELFPLRKLHQAAPVTMLTRMTNASPNPRKAAAPKLSCPSR